jgi:hypothetical protein
MLSDPTPPEADVLEGAAYLVGEMQRLRHVMERALPYTHRTHELNDLALLVLQGRARLWTTANSFCIVEKVVYPRQTNYHVFLAGGDMDELRGLHDQISAAARADGAAAVTLTGRRGWVKALAAWGWKEEYATMRLDLAEVDHGR